MRADRIDPMSAVRLPPAAHHVAPVAVRAVRRPGAAVLGVHVDAIGWTAAAERIWRWARFGQARQVCCCNVHAVVEAGRNPLLRAALASADLVVPDGMPVAWMLRRLGHARQPRIDGPGLMWRTCALAEATSLPIYLYGTTDATLARLRTRLAAAFPRLQLAGWHAPSFGPPDPAAEALAVARIRRSGARIVFVGLGCPKQELWMSRQRAQLPAVLLGVGAAFDYHAGTVRRAPPWMQGHGLEWLYRLGTEPRRLARRYAVTNTRFMLGVVRQLCRGRQAATELPAANDAAPVRPGLTAPMAANAVQVVPPESCLRRAR